MLYHNSETKICSRCCEKKTLARFYKRSNGNPQSYCIACQRKWDTIRVRERRHEKMLHDVEQHRKTKEVIQHMYPAWLYGKVTA